MASVMSSTAMLPTKEKEKHKGNTLCKIAAKDAMAGMFV
jgi:hypothetical protein